MILKLGAMLNLVIFIIKFIHSFQGTKLKVTDLAQI